MGVVLTEYEERRRSAGKIMVAKMSCCIFLTKSIYYIFHQYIKNFGLDTITTIT